MPELPEVETIRARLAPRLEGRRLERVEIVDPRLTRPEPPEAIAAALEGERIVRVSRRGKYLVFEFESGRHLLVHLRMTGNVEHPAQGGLAADPYRRAVVRLDDGSDVAYRDVRRFGTWDLLEPGELEDYFAVRRLGGEPLEGGFTTRALAQALEGRTRADESRPSRPARCGRDREHLRGRGTLACATPSAPSGRVADRRRDRAPPKGDPRRPGDGHFAARARRCATTAIPKAVAAGCRTSSRSTGAPVSPARAAGRRSRRRAPAAEARGSVRSASDSTPARIAVVKPWSFEPNGRFEEVDFDSTALEGNPLGDPHERPLWVYLPPGYDDEPERRYPSVYMIQGLTGQLDMWRNRAPFRRNFPELVDELFAARRGTAVHRRLRRLLDLARRQPVPRLAGDRPLPHVPLRRGRALGGRPLPHARRPRAPRDRRQVERRLRRHGHADAAARPLRRPRHARRRRALRSLLPARVPRDGPRAPRRVRRLVRALLGGLPLAPGRSRRRPTTYSSTSWCMAACYSTDADGTVRLPFDTATGELIPEVWERWLAWDPVRMVPKPRRRAPVSSKAIYIDAGKRDE